MKFGALMKNHIPMAMKRSKWKPEVEFQDEFQYYYYGGRLFSESGSGNFLAMD